ncbi:hypothetical protein PsYK624_062030 [Phanerochaete sordida]|uniref:F-box domain-containing protein n=1 Tax=Phanerochaete sordida TaxID=48140 RepID=A0A9P3G8W9_9APHY|nr:hypothetical protein PsYK624_062030 [Phanerochaete sordida]
MFPKHFNLPPSASFCDVRNADEAIEDLQSYLLALKQRRNTLIPVGRLPEDVLLEIFAHLVQMHDCPDVWNTVHPQPHGWLLAINTCRAWRAASLSYARLWSTIHIMPWQPEERIAAFLARSAGCTLTFESPYCQRTLYSGLDIIFGHHGQRLRAVHGLGVEDEGALTLEALTSRDGPLQLPNLEILSMTIQLDDIAAIPALGEAFMPKLRHLVCVEAPHTVLSRLIRPTLTELRFWGSPFEHVPLASWLELLAQLPTLKILSLVSIIAPMEADMSTAHDRRVHLPRLRELNLEVIHDYTPRSTASYAQLLRHLSHPPHLRVLMKALCGKSDAHSWLTEAQSIFSYLQDGSAAARSGASMTGMAAAPYTPMVLDISLGWSDPVLRLAPPTFPDVVQTDLPLSRLHIFIPPEAAAWLPLLTAAEPLCTSSGRGTLYVMSRDARLWSALQKLKFFYAHSLQVVPSCLGGFVKSLDDALEGDDPHQEKRQAPADGLLAIHRIAAG